MARRRSVSDEEARLLEHAMANVQPIKRRAKRPQPAPAPAAGAVKAPPPASIAKAGARPHPAVSPGKAPPPAKRAPAHTIDRRTEQRLKRGRTPIEATLDLHGQKQGEAHRNLNRFIARAAAQGHRAVLVITGKGTQEGAQGEGFMPSGRKGVLRAQVPLWLAEPPLAEHVLAVKTAGPRHGGSGALYVLLRKPSKG